MSDQMTESKPQDLMGNRKKFGELLKSIREESGYSIRGLAHATRIQIDHLTAMEVGDFENLPDKVYVRGFIRSVCQFFKADQEQLLGELDDCYTKNVSVPDCVTHTNFSSVHRTAPQALSLDLTKISLGAGLMALIAVIAVVVVQVDQAEVKVAKTPKINQKGQVSVLVDSVRESVVEQPAAQTEPSSVKEDAVVSTHELRLRVKETVQVKVGVDQKGMEVVTLSPKSHIYNFEKYVNLLVYDAAALSITFDGKELGALGRAGRVRRLTFAARDQIF